MPNYPFEFAYVLNALRHFPPLAAPDVGFILASEVHESGEFHLHLFFYNTKGKRIRFSTESFARHCLQSMSDKRVMVNIKTRACPVGMRIAGGIEYAKKEGYWVHVEPEGGLVLPDQNPPKTGGKKALVAKRLMAGEQLGAIALSDVELAGYISTMTNGLRTFGSMIDEHRQATSPLFPEDPVKRQMLRQVLQETAEIDYYAHREQYESIRRGYPDYVSRLREVGLGGLQFHDDSDGTSVVAFCIQNWWMMKVVNWLMDNICCQRSRETHKQLMLYSVTGMGKTGLREALEKLLGVYRWMYITAFQTLAPHHYLIVLDEWKCQMPLQDANDVADGAIRINRKGEPATPLPFELPVIAMTNIPFELHYSKLDAAVHAATNRSSAEVQAYRRRWLVVNIPGEELSLKLAPVTNILEAYARLAKGDAPVREHRFKIGPAAGARPISPRAQAALESMFKE